MEEFDYGQEEFLFDTREEAEAAQKLADADWSNNQAGEVFVPEANIMRVRIIDNMMEPDENGLYWAVFEAAYSEYMVSNKTNTWVCVV